LSRHGLDFIHRQVQLGGNLLIGKVQAHEVQAQDPNFQRQMMPFKDGSRQIIKLFATGLTAVALAVSLMSMKAAFTDPLRLAKRAVNALRPADFADFFVTLMFVNQVMNLEKHALILPSRLSVCHLLETVKEPIFIIIFFSIVKDKKSLPRGCLVRM
jgi:hypothetical protein